MIKPLLFLIIIFSFISPSIVNGQVKKESSGLKNSITFETGFYSRGLIGIGYGRHVYSKTENTRYSIGCGMGFGLGGRNNSGNSIVPEPTENLKVFCNMQIASGPHKVKFCIGLEPKIVLRSYSTILLPEKTFATAAYMGFNHIDQLGFTFEFRWGISPHFQLGNFDYKNVTPSFGFSIGKSF